MNNNNLLTAVLTILISLSITGCGGGGSANNTGSNENQPTVDPNLQVSIHPENLAAVRNGSNINLSWDAVPKADSYNINLSTIPFTNENKSYEEREFNNITDTSISIYSPITNAIYAYVSANIPLSESPNISGTIEIYGVTEATGSLKPKQTGQGLSFEIGQTVSTTNIGSVKDDGYYRKGIEHVYTLRRKEGIVEDNLTGLMWDDEKVMHKVPSRSELPVSTTSPSPVHILRKEYAESYCGRMTKGGYNDWRAPSFLETFTTYLLKQGASDAPYNLRRAGETLPILSPVFRITEGVRTDTPSPYLMALNDYNSLTYQSVSYTDGVHYAGSYLRGASEQAPQAMYLRCVRGKFTPIDNNHYRSSDKIITDAHTELQWEDHTTHPRVTWTEALDYCESLNLGGYEDWRLPNINELLSTSLTKLDEMFTLEPVPPSPFVYLVQPKQLYSYWSSTTWAYLGQTNQHYRYYYYSSGYTGKQIGSIRHETATKTPVRCVRN